RVDDVRGVGFLLAPGDEVNIFVAGPLQIPQETLDALIAQKGLAPDEVYFQPPDYVQALYQRVHVLAVGTSTVRLPGESVTEDGEADDTEVDAGLVTLNVPPDAVQRIASWRDNIYFSLVPEDYSPADQGPIDP